MSRRALSLGACAVALVASRSAEAHAQLLQATPSVGSSVQVVPDKLLLVFSESIEPAFSFIHVTDGAAARVDRDDLHLEPHQPTRLAIGLQRLPPGAYRVEWKVTSVDTHKTQGIFTFRVIAP